MITYTLERQHNGQKGLYLLDKSIISDLPKISKFLGKVELLSTITSQAAKWPVCCGYQGDLLTLLTAGNRRLLTLVNYFTYTFDWRFSGKTASNKVLTKGLRFTKMSGPEGADISQYPFSIIRKKEKAQEKASLGGKKSKANRWPEFKANEYA